VTGAREPTYGGRPRPRGGGTAARLPGLRGLSGALALVWSLWMATTGVSAAQPYSESSTKASFLYRFGGYVEWPPDAPTTPQFTIAVLGDDEVAAKLRKLLPGHYIKGRPAQVRRIRTIRELGDAQMLYIGAARAADVRTVTAATGALPVLIVTDEEHGLDDGGVINFMVVETHVRFEISLDAAARCGLKVSSDLGLVAARVQGRGSN
jgi:hypothetical protein